MEQPIFETEEDEIANGQKHEKKKNSSKQADDKPDILNPGPQDVLLGRGGGKSWLIPFAFVQVYPFLHFNLCSL